MSLLGIKNIILAINKLDLIKYDEITYNKIKKEFFKFSKKLNFKKINCIPISALDGDNIIKKSKNTLWYDGNTLLEYLETTDKEFFEAKP